MGFFALYGQAEARIVRALGPGSRVYVFRCAGTHGMLGFRDGRVALTFLCVSPAESPTNKAYYEINGTDVYVDEKASAFLRRLSP